MTAEKRGADEDGTLAFVTTFRFFVQPRDGVSLWQIAGIYDSLPVEAMAKDSARAAVDWVDNYFNQSTMFVIHGEPITNRRLFEVFMYGGLAHANEDKRIEYEDWMKGSGSVWNLTRLISAGELRY